MDNKYIDAFFEEITWQFKRNDVMMMEKEEFSCSALFMDTFPKLNILLNKAVAFRTVLKNGSCFRLFCWENNGAIGGWLCQNCKHTDTELPHLNLLKEYVGTIMESWGFEEIREDLFLNMDGVLLDNIIYGIGKEWNAYFKEFCESEGIFPQIHDEDYILIAEEANGNLTLCNKNNEEIVLFATDHDFDYVEAYPSCPDYTFYKINNADSLISYFELAAQQWLAYLE